MRKLIFLCAVVSCMLCSCIKAPTYPIIPHIEFTSVSSSYVTSGSLDTISFSFTDGDGDIGPGTSTGDTNTDCCNNDTSCFFLSNFNIFLIDSRGNHCVSYFQSPDLRPSGKYKDISGTMQVLTTITSFQCFPCNSSCTALDSVKYTIVIRDMAGHFSNRAETSAIYASCGQ